MELRNIVVDLILFCSVIYKVYSTQCDKIPQGEFSDKNIKDKKYTLEIPGKPEKYVPNQKYKILLKKNPEWPADIAFFKRFIITLEQDIQNVNGNIGQLQLETGAQAVTKFSIDCPNTVDNFGLSPKTEIQVSWIAPPENSGCVAIKATVIESRDSWFSEDGLLTKVLCEESEKKHIELPLLEHCCACDEAKYEMAFEGKWTRNTHPKDFPNHWSTGFSDVIGASHQPHYAFWNYEGIASEGLKELAETGSSQTLESEIKDMISTEHVRTIIKARGLQYPNITQSTFARFRVDYKNHLVSLVSKISPSPDWIVGVSNLELCKEDCTWDESKTLELFPWDVGTDDGINYTSSKPLSVKQSIHRITPNHPNDPNSPFFNKDGHKILPLAKIHLTRQKLYKNSCPEIKFTSSQEYEGECATTDWSEWLPCSAVCGEGKQYRFRNYVEKSSKNYCNMTLVDEQTCYRKLNRFCREQVDETTTEISIQSTDISSQTEASVTTISPDSEQCEVGEWGTWSTCSVSCGKGTKTRDRKLIDPNNEKICGVELQENAECEGSGNNCDTTEVKCPDGEWYEWSSCIVSNVTKCGKGYKRRYRRPANVDNNNEDDEDNEEEQMDGTCFMETVECHEPCEGTEAEEYGESSVILDQGPDGKVVNCKVSPWSTWSRCVLSGSSCGSGYKYANRQILRHAQNGGRACPKYLLKKEECRIPCTETAAEKDHRASYSETNQDNTSVCITGPWLQWSPCSSICGPSAVQIRTRRIYYQAPGVTCQRLEERPCHLPVACSDKGQPIF